MAACCSQMNLPVQICDAFSLIGGRSPDCANNIGSFLLPEYTYCLLGLLASAHLPRQIPLQLVLVHIERHHLGDQPESALNELIELISLDGRILEEVSIEIFKVDLSTFICSFFRSSTSLLSFLNFLEVIAEFDLGKSLEQGKIDFPVDLTRYLYINQTFHCYNLIYYL